MNTNVHLEVSGLTLGYDGVPVVRGLSLTVSGGEILAVLGPNGAGKSTTLSACAGFLTPMAGTVHFNGSAIAGLPAQKVARLGVAHVPEGRGIFHGLTVEEHLRLAQRGTRSGAALGHFPELDKMRDRRAGLLSGGEQQMLALATAFLRQPSVLLIDELSLGLAPIIVERLMPLIRSYADESGCGVVLVEQHVHLALEVADRAMVLSHGEVVLEGPAANLRHSRELLMASYIGESALSHDSKQGS